jgi:hypothetical protein
VEVTEVEPDLGEDARPGHACSITPPHLQTELADYLGQAVRVTIGERVLTAAAAVWDASN